MLAAKTCPAARPSLASRRAGACGVPRTAGPVIAAPARRVAAQAFDDTNLFVNILGSCVAGAAVAAVTTFTSENKDSEIERIQTVDGALPIGAAVVADAVAHSIPGLNILFSLLSEPLGAAAGVAYMMVSAAQPNPVNTRKGARYASWRSRVPPQPRRRGLSRQG
jgi:hypothetical protein